MENVFGKCFRCKMVRWFYKHCQMRMARCLWVQPALCCILNPSVVSCSRSILKLSEGSQPRKSTAPAVQVAQSVGGSSAYQRRLTTCKAELQQLVLQKREQCSAERMAKQMMESAEWESRPPPPGTNTPNSHTQTCIGLHPQVLTLPTLIPRRVQASTPRY